MKTNKVRLIGMVLILIGITFHFIIDIGMYGFVNGALIGGGLGMILFIGRKKDKSAAQLK